MRSGVRGGWRSLSVMILAFSHESVFFKPYEECAAREGLRLVRLPAPLRERGWSRSLLAEGREMAEHSGSDERPG